MLPADLMAYLLAAAVRFSGLPDVALTELPPIEPVTALVLSQKVCPDAPERCNSVAALFDTEGYRIYVRDTLNMKDPMDNSFLVHELVHVLQFKKFGESYFSSCRKVIHSEQQAYYVQNNYLGDEGIDWREGFLLRFMTCPPEEGDAKDELRRDEG